MLVLERNSVSVSDDEERWILVKYMQAAMRRAKYELLADDGSFYGEIPVCNGVYANAPTLEACREQLAEVLEEWIVLRVHKDRPVPVTEGIKLAIEEVP